MVLRHQTILLRSGAKIRFVAINCLYQLDAPIYQYTVDMLFSDNNWERIYVSPLYHNAFIFMLRLDKVIKRPNKFNVIYLTKQAREKYGRETIFDSHQAVKV